MSSVLTGNQLIERAFKKKNEQGKPAFIPFIMGGYPSFQATIDIALVLQEAGADILELGIPYSDPLADGPVIQEASKGALEQGMSLSKGIELIRHLRHSGVHIPIIPFCYYNPILQYGLEAFVLTAKEAGANGVLVPDLPYEEARALSEICQKHEFVFISLVAPTSEQRVEQIVRQATGFVYCISSLGVTGVREGFSVETETFLQQIKNISAVPVAVGFGVSKREHVRHLAPYVDGIVIGSAIVKLISDYHDLFLQESMKKDALLALKTFVQETFSE